MLLGACRCDAPPVAPTAPGPPAPPRELNARGLPSCRADRECAAGWKCACSLPECSLTPSFTTQVGSPSGDCFSPAFLAMTDWPYKTDGGWTRASLDGGRTFPSEDEAWQDFFAPLEGR